MGAFGGNTLHKQVLFSFNLLLLSFVHRPRREVRGMSAGSTTTLLIGGCETGEILSSNEEGEASTPAPALN